MCPAITYAIASITPPSGVTSAQASSIFSISGSTLNMVTSDPTLHGIYTVAVTAAVPTYKSGTFQYTVTLYRCADTTISKNAIGP